MFPIRDHNPSGTIPYVTIALIAINVFAFFSYFSTMNDFQLNRFFLTWGFIPARVMAGEGVETIVTSMFLHASVMHLLGNMLFLWIYGDNLEAEMGPVGFLLFYLASGLAAAGLQALADLGSTIPMVGASGAIAGVMGGYLLLFPRARIDVLFIFVIFFRIFAIPAWVLLGLWFALQIFSGVNTPTEGGGVAYWAHAGGFVAGLLLTLPVWARRGAEAFWRRTEGHPPHPESQFAAARSNIPLIPRRRR